MRNIILFTTLLLFIYGCSTKDHDPLKENFEKNRTAYKNLQKTEKAQLYDDNVTKALLTATYLYVPVDPLTQERKDEVFVVGIYLEEDWSDKIGGEYTLRLEGMKPKSIKPLSHESNLLASVPFVTEWSSYYLVQFPHTDKKSFYLDFQSKRYGKVKMHFSKVAKYLESKKAF